MNIEDLNLRPAVKKAIILLLYRANVKVLKDALAHLGPYPTLTLAWYSDPGGINTVLLPAPSALRARWRQPLEGDRAF